MVQKLFDDYRPSFTCNKAFSFVTKHFSHKGWCCITDIPDDGGNTLTTRLLNIYLSFYATIKIRITVIYCDKFISWSK